VEAECGARVFGDLKALLALGVGEEAEAFLSDTLGENHAHARRAACSCGGKGGGKPYAKNYINSTSCPRGGWKYQVTANYVYETPGQPADNVNKGSIPCTK